MLRSNSFVLTIIGKNLIFMKVFDCNHKVQSRSGYSYKNKNNYQQQQQQIKIVKSLHDESAWKRHQEDIWNMYSKAKSYQQIM